MERSCDRRTGRPAWTRPLPDHGQVAEVVSRALRLPAGHPFLTQHHCRTRSTGEQPGTTVIATEPGETAVNRSARSQLHNPPQMPAASQADGSAGEFL